MGNLLERSQKEGKMPLKGVKVLELLGLAPGPYCGMILKEFGASVTVVQRVEGVVYDDMSNGKKGIALNLKTREGAGIFKKLSKNSDVLIDTFRPGVMENLGLGPDVLMKENRGLVYARITGYGQTGFYKDKAGHDINYVAISGVLSTLIKDKQPPQPPINLLADFAGGGLMCAFGILLALINRSKTGLGQVVDNSMAEGSSYLASFLFRTRDLPIWGNEPGKNILDGGVPFYNTYKTKDGKFMAVGALEPKFYEDLLKGLDLPIEEYSQFETEKCKEKFTEIFSGKTQDEWCKIFDKLDACVTPVLDYDNVAIHEHNYSRNAFLNSNSYPVPIPAPRLSSTPGVCCVLEAKPSHGQHTAEILRELGYNKDEMLGLADNGHIFFPVKASL